MNQDYKFAILDYFTSNIGDNIQSIAIRKFLPKVDFLINRDFLPIVKTEYKTKIILNGWFSHRSDLWPIKNNNLKPLFISFHISNENSVGAFAEKMLTDECVAYYKKYEPIGCRDYVTMNLLKEKGVSVYFSGCATLTIENPSNIKNNNIYIVDLLEIPEKLIPFDNVIRRSHHISEYYNNKYEIAIKMLNEYSQAKMVITSKLHCALPCISMGVPTIFINSNKNDPRFSGYEDILNIVEPSEIMSGNFDWNNIPKPNMEKVFELRKNLINKISEFINS